MAASNREKIARGLEILAAGLGPFVGQHMSAKLPAGAPADTDWIAVLEARDNQRGGAKRTYSADDPRFLLRMLTEEWRMFDGALSRVEQSYASELRDVGNRWAHNNSFTGDDTGRALDTMERLLTAAGAGPQADQIGKLRLDHQRAQYEELTRKSVRAAVGTVSTPGTGLKPWREVITPHRDVIDGQFNAAEYAADLHQVATGQAQQSEYTEPVEFFARTYLTEGLRDLLSRAVARLSGDVNASPVVNLQTTFGGGKTHSMLALYHLFSGLSVSEFPQAVQDVVTVAGSAALETLNVRRVTLVGTHLSPNQPLIKDDGTRVNTLWGELAWQLGGRAAFDRVAQSDATGTPPGDALADLVREHAPVLIEIDEWVAYARGLYGQEGLAGGTFESQFTFAQHLTEVVRSIPRAMLVVSIPASDALDSGGSGSALEVGGANGRAALERLQHVVGRTADQWRPAGPMESFEIVKRRLFSEPDAAARADIAGVARQFVTFYRDNSGQFPREVESGDYEKRVVTAYPIHPELFDRLYGDWSTLEKFQRTRGVLRLMSTVIHALWTAQDSSPLIMPGTVPIHVPNVAGELRQYLPDTWNSVVDTDVDGEGSTPVRIDAERPTFGARALTRRIARTIFLASAPTKGTAHRGAEKPRIWLGVAIPGDTVGNFGSSLEMLGQRATYLYYDGGRYWYDTTASVTRTAADFADRLRDEPETVWAEIRRRLEPETRKPGQFARVHVAPETSGDVPDTEEARLVVLHPRFTHAKGTSESEAMRFANGTLVSCGSAQRVRRNALVFIAPDTTRYDDLDGAVREFLAWSHITANAAEMDLTAQQTATARARQQQANDAVEARISAAYVWGLIPEQPDASAPAAVVTEKVPEGRGSLAERVSDRLARDGRLTSQYGALGIRMALNGPLASVWESGHASVGAVWDLYTRYPYLDRLKDRSVFLDAVRSVMTTLTWFQEGFALAAGYDDSAGRYTGLVLPGDAVDPAPTDDWLLVKPDVASAQREAEEAAEDARRSTDAPAAEDINAEVAPPPMKAQAAFAEPTVETTPPKPTRFFGVYQVSAERYARDFARISSEILPHLTSSGADLEITIELQAANSSGFDPDTVRTVTENATTLKFDQAGFERE